MAAQIVTLLATEVHGGWWKPSTCRTNWRGALRRGFYALAVVWTVTFAICIVTTIYDDHRALSDRLRTAVNENNHLKSELQNTASCANESRNIQVRRKIESDLSEFITEGSGIRDDWKTFMAQHMTQHLSQQSYAIKARAWHEKVENYLRTIPRGNNYVARLKAAPRTGLGGWPQGIDYAISEAFDMLTGDLAMLEEFMKDPDLGKSA